MELEYDLNNLSKQETCDRRSNLQDELAPRNQCRSYVMNNGGKAVLIAKAEFDKSCRKGDFLDGPFSDSFGDGHGEPYNPNRQAFGKLKSGRVTYCEISEANIKLTKELSKLIG